MSDLKLKSGHLVYTPGGHLAICSSDCVYCIDYNQNWDVTVADIVCNERNYANCLPGVSSGGFRRWGYADLPTLDFDVNDTHAISTVQQPGTSTCVSTGFTNCVVATGIKSVDIEGALHLSPLVTTAAAKPASGAFTAYPFTLTMEVMFIVYDYCGQRYAAVHLYPVNLAYDDTNVAMAVEGNMCILHMDFIERVPCGTLPLSGDDEWYNSGSFGGNAIRGYEKSDSTPNVWRAGSAYIRTIKQVTGTAGSFFSATP